MARTGVAALSLAVLLAVFEIGACIRCYQCNSQNDPNCRDPFEKKSMIVDCASQDAINYNNQFLRPLLPQDESVSLTNDKAVKMCHKLTTKSGTIVRACLATSPLNQKQACQLLTLSSVLDPNKKIADCNVCDTDGCNGVGSISASLPLAALTVIISYLVFKQ